MGAGFVCKAKADKTAEILIYEDVGDGWFGGVTAKQFSEELKALGDVQSIDVRINSYGGDVFEGLAIYNALVRHKASITTHVDGIAASIASVIAMAGNKINIAESGWMMVHDAWGVAMGNAEEMRSMADKLEATSKTLSNVYAARTGHHESDIRGWMATEKWMDATEAVSLKFADTVSENLRMAARSIPERFAFRHVPDLLMQVAVRQEQPTSEATRGDAQLRSDLAALTDRVRRQAALLRARGAGA